MVGGRSYLRLNTTPSFLPMFPLEGWGALDRRASISPPADVTCRKWSPPRLSLILLLRRRIRSWYLFVSLLPTARLYIRYHASCEIHAFHGEVLGYGCGIALRSDPNRVSALDLLSTAGVFIGKRHKPPRQILFSWMVWLRRKPRTMYWSLLWKLSLTARFENFCRLVARR